MNFDLAASRGRGRGSSGTSRGGGGSGRGGGGASGGGGSWQGELKHHQIFNHALLNNSLF